MLQWTFFRTSIKGETSRIVSLIASCILFWLQISCIKQFVCLKPAYWLVLNYLSVCLMLSFWGDNDLSVSFSPVPHPQSQSWAWHYSKQAWSILFKDDKLHLMRLNWRTIKQRRHSKMILSTSKAIEYFSMIWNTVKWCASHAFTFLSWQFYAWSSLYCFGLLICIFKISR